MNFFKNLFDEIKNSSFISNTIDILKPTEDWILNKGGFIVLLMTIPLALISLALAGMVSTLSFKLGGFIGFIASSILNVLIFIFISMGVNMACFQGFNTLVNQGRRVTILEFITITFKGAIEFTFKYIKYVGIYLFIITLAGKALRYLPSINGNTIANLINAFIVYGLLFRMYAFMLGKDGDREIVINMKYWMTFAIVAYLIDLTTSFEVITSLLKYTFTLFSILCLSNKNTISTDSFNDGFEDIIKTDNSNSINKEIKNNISEEPFDDGFRDSFQF